MRRPRFIAEQSRHARGLLGRFIAFVMARETLADNERASEALAIKENDHILDVGCGHGRGLAALAARARRGRVVGADPSDLMAEIAMTRNQALVKAQKVEIVVATASDLPFGDAVFDKALCVHVIYFWKDLGTGLREIARVLKPGGTFSLVFRSSQHTAAVQAFPADVYRFPDVEEVTSALADAGFSIVGEDAQDEGLHRPHMIVAVRVDGR